MVDTGVYQIINAKSDTALDESGTEQGAIIGWEKHQGENQKWYIDKRNDNYTIRNLRSGQYIGLANNDVRDDARAHSVNEPFEWQIRNDDQDRDVYRFFVPGTPFNLDLTNFGDSKGGTPVAIWGKWEGKNQCWRLNRLS
ncbi:carbohydrate-binding module family 13 protein [Amanita muscaria Koide BX008]|uniref:Carbohydrate-binding module family 13 protein n=1 Tax=Amanita muscaria (strain Koide BX008) TaxID=946122 RepID=A0A0C2SIS3_AMAMK|nr:carbohydrate-binding module family 13 protein [Amanita muscaria Koide BX008]